ncbi:MAG: adenylate kinase [Parcubacteria group bacterium Greene0416_39]|nr:MAG: adenylate kinase [Parcubacteria group bacterium Greene0416_39]TSC97713.1 MAG: adenylate kinase [Parcubacteria group bacterium Greene1014_47]
MKAFNTQVVILMGPPGAGKGTQAELLSEKLNLSYIETAKLLEAKFWNAKVNESMEGVDGNAYDLLHEKNLWATGILCSPPFVTAVLNEKFRELHKEGKGLLLAGSPRTLYEGEKELPVLEELYGKENIHIILLELSEEQTLYRNSHRRICELMRHPVLYTKETENLTICPLDGSKLLRREGLDDSETIKVRIKEYQERTLPVVSYFEQSGFEVQKVNADQSVADVFSDIFKALNLA